MAKNLSIREAVEKSNAFSATIAFLEIIMDLLGLKVEEAAPKPMQDFADYQHAAKMFYTSPQFDRIFPLENTRISEFEQKHNLDAPDVMIHDGYHADEIARSMHALAVTIGTDIYFRRNAYNPSTEEGRKLLAHELTHVSQYATKRITKSIPRGDLEKEAVREEEKESSGFDKMMTVELDGKQFRFRESQLEKVSSAIAQEFSTWVKELKYSLSEREYLSHLCAISDWLGERV